jgi:hypothetical protein
MTAAHDKLKEFSKRQTQMEKEVKKIISNGKEIGVEKFHKAIVNLGFINHDGLHIHRLLNPEITQLSHFTGDGLWKLVDHAYGCRKLAQVIEENHVSINGSRKSRGRYLGSHKEAVMCFRIEKLRKNTKKTKIFS